MEQKHIPPIEYSALLLRQSTNEFYYIRHIFNALRDHREYLALPDYKRLYEEALDYLFRHAVKYCGWSEDKWEWGCDWIEFYADLDNRYAENEHIEKYSIQTVDALLESRKKLWH